MPAILPATLTNFGQAREERKRGLYTTQKTSQPPKTNSTETTEKLAPHILLVAGAGLEPATFGL